MPVNISVPKYKKLPKYKIKSLLFSGVWQILILLIIYLRNFVNEILTGTIFFRF